MSSSKASLTRGRKAKADALVRAGDLAPFVRAYGYAPATGAHSTTIPASPE